VVGQERVIKILRAYIDSGYNTPIIFSGGYGCGKTTLTKVLASHYHSNKEAIWTNSHPSVIQVNAANRTGVKEIASLIETVHYRPLEGENKTYIIDECHALSHAAFNAFLDALENLPSNTRFFFATTDKHRIPDTVLSRSFVLSLDPVPCTSIKARLEQIADSENILIAPEVLELIATHSNGSVRDGIKNLTQISMLGANPDIAEVRALLEIPSDQYISAIVDGIRSADYAVCKKLQPAMHPYRTLVALLTQIQSFADTERWVPVVQALLESVEVVRFGIHADLILQIAIAKAIYVYRLSSKLKYEPAHADSEIQRIFPGAVREE
jgi:DNA polymerase-3 subunit gamma/tau